MGTMTATTRASAGVVASWRANRRRKGISDLVIALAAAMPVETLESLLRETLGDRTLTLEIHDATGDSGRPADISRALLRDNAAVGRTRSFLSHEGVVVAVLDRDDAAVIDPVLLAAVAAGTAMHLQMLRYLRMGDVSDLEFGLRALQTDLVVAVTNLRRYRQDVGSDLSVVTGSRLDLVDEALSDAIGRVRGLLGAASAASAPLLTAVTTLVHRLPLPVDVRADAIDWPDDVATLMLFVIQEALTNTIRHADASRASVLIGDGDGAGDHGGGGGGGGGVGGGACVQVRDDGRGGADARPGGGLAGLSRRLERLHGTLDVASCPGTGTTITAWLPLESPLREHPPERDIAS